MTSENAKKLRSSTTRPYLPSFFGPGISPFGAFLGSTQRNTSAVQCSIVLDNDRSVLGFNDSFTEACDGLDPYDLYPTTADDEKKSRPSFWNKQVKNLKRAVSGSGQPKDATPNKKHLDDKSSEEIGSSANLSTNFL